MCEFVWPSFKNKNNKGTMQSLPIELESHILRLNQGLFDQLVPRGSGATAHPFFQMQQKKTRCVPSVEDRDVKVPLPRELSEVYAKYPPDVEFSFSDATVADQWTFLSEDEMYRRWRYHVDAGQPRMVDMAIKYIGMGHVRVLAYDPDDRLVYTDYDGGSNGWDQMSNAKTRNDCIVGSRSDRRNFVEWFHEVISTKETM